MIYFLKISCKQKLLSNYSQTNMSDPLNIQDMTPFQNTQELNVTLPRPRRARRCGHCRAEGHDRRTCPGLEEHRQQVALQRQQRARERLERQTLELQQRREQMERSKRSVAITNSTDYNLVIMWTGDKKPLEESSFKTLGLLLPWETRSYKFYNHHRVIAVPIFENIYQQEISIRITEETTLFLDMNIEDLESVEENGNTPTYPIGIITPTGFKPPKNELEQWKETAFKSLYLLKELERMGAGNNENLAPMIDMIQDITIPKHTQYDKEFAGVPSSLTNIT